jgi:hypothetical protein
MSGVTCKIFEAALPPLRLCAIAAIKSDPNLHAVLSDLFYSASSYLMISF